MILNKNIERRIVALEKTTRGPVISTLCDLVRWVDDHENDENATCDLSPEMEKLVDEASKYDEDEAN